MFLLCLILNIRCRIQVTHSILAYNLVVIKWCGAEIHMHEWWFIISDNSIIECIWLIWKILCSTWHWHKSLWLMLMIKTCCLSLTWYLWYRMTSNIVIINNWILDGWVLRRFQTIRLRVNHDITFLLIIHFFLLQIPISMLFTCFLIMIIFIF